MFQPSAWWGVIAMIIFIIYLFWSEEIKEFIINDYNSLEK